MSLHAEHLPPEIWLNIFTFFEGHDLVRAFSCLNSFFNSLLRSLHIQLYIRIKQNESNERLPTLTWSHINRQNIYSLVVGQRKANCLIQFLRWNAQYLIHLSSLSVCLRKRNSYYNIQFLIHAIGQLPSLNRLRIKYTTKFDSNSDEFDPLLANICSSRFNIQNYSFICDMSDYTMKTSTWSINPFLKYLHTENISCYNLFSLLSFTPQLHSLQSIINRSNTVLQQNIILTHLEKINLSLNYARFSQLQRIKQAVPNLKSLQLTGLLYAHDDNYLNENLWHQLLDKIKYFRVNLEAISISPSPPRITVLKNLIQNLNEKSWISYEEPSRSLRIYIKFQSASI